MVLFSTGIPAARVPSGGKKRGKSEPVQLARKASAEAPVEGGAHGLGVASRQPRTIRARAMARAAKPGKPTLWAIGAYLGGAAGPAGPSAPAARRAPREQFFVVSRAVRKFSDHQVFQPRRLN